MGVMIHVLTKHNAITLLFLIATASKTHQRQDQEKRWVDVPFKQEEAGSCYAVAVLAALYARGMITSCVSTKWKADNLFTIKLGALGQELTAYHINLDKHLGYKIRENNGSILADLVCAALRLRYAATYGDSKKKLWGFMDHCMAYDFAIPSSIIDGSGPQNNLETLDQKSLRKLWDDGCIITCGRVGIPHAYVILDIQGDNPIFTMLEPRKSSEEIFKLPGSKGDGVYRLDFKEFQEAFECLHIGYPQFSEREVLTMDRGDTLSWTVNASCEAVVHVMVEDHLARNWDMWNAGQGPEITIIEKLKDEIGKKHVLNLHGLSILLQPDSEYTATYNGFRECECSLKDGKEVPIGLDCGKCKGTGKILREASSVKLVIATKEKLSYKY